MHAHQHLPVLHAASCSRRRLADGTRSNRSNLTHPHGHSLCTQLQAQLYPTDRRAKLPYGCSCCEPPCRCITLLPCGAWPCGARRADGRPGAAVALQGPRGSAPVRASQPAAAHGARAQGPHAARHAAVAALVPVAPSQRQVGLTEALMRRQLCCCTSCGGRGCCAGLDACIRLGARVDCWQPGVARMGWGAGAHSGPCGSKPLLRYEAVASDTSVLRSCCEQIVPCCCTIEADL